MCEMKGEEQRNGHRVGEGMKLRLRGDVGEARGNG